MTVRTTSPAREVTILNPAVQPRNLRGKLAPRLTDRGRPRTLDGLRVGLLDNVKTNADAFLDQVEVRIRADFEVREFVRRTKPQAGQPCPPEMFEQLAQCDLVINAFGD